MRINLPVTSQEVLLEEGQTIVSTTDLQGNITYANPYFIHISGFTEEELIGAPQNILRHPDMPAEAFADLWQSIGKGFPWTGMVKNRCKNGDYYWVYANVTPVLENGQATGGCASTASTVVGVLRRARGLPTAHSRCATTTWASASRSKPRSCRKRSAGTVKVEYGVWAP